MTPTQSLVRSTSMDKSIAGRPWRLHWLRASLRRCLLIQGGRGSMRFPLATSVVNLLGCLLIGFLSQLAETRDIFNANERTLIFVGLLGGFTTFSAFGNEPINLWRG